MSDTTETTLNRTATLAHLAQQPLRTTGGIFFSDNATKLTLQILTIHTKYGPTSTIHATEELARNELYEHVSYWWESEVGDREEEIDTFNDCDKAIDAYFSHLDDEYYEIEQGTFDLADIVT